MTIRIFCIVEGHGEERAFPNIIRKYLSHLGRYDVEIYRPYRIGKDQFHKGDVISEVVRLGCARIRADLEEGDTGLVLLSHDSDSECPVTLRKDIESKLEDKGLGFDRIEVVICHCEFEAWFLASSQSFLGNADCKAIIPQFANPEAVRDAKGTFEREVLRDGRYYSETVDQQKFASLIDFDLHPETRARSLRRLTDVLATA